MRLFRALPLRITDTPFLPLVFAKMTVLLSIDVKWPSPAHLTSESPVTSRCLCSSSLMRRCSLPVCLSVRAFHVPTCSMCFLFFLILGAAIGCRVPSSSGSNLRERFKFALSYPMVLTSDCFPSPVAKASVPVLGGSAVAEDRLCVMLSVVFWFFCKSRYSRLQLLSVTAVPR